MEIPETMLEVLKKDGVVAIATLGPDGPHMVNTWNSYIQVAADGRLLIPAGYFHKTETNIAANNTVLVTLGSSKVRGLNGAGTGFLVKGREGISGGFVLSKPSNNIHVSEVLKAVDPGRSLFACAEIRQNCALFGAIPPRWAVTGPCRIHAFMEEAERKLHGFLASKTLSDLVCEYTCKAPKEFAVETEGWFQDRKKARTVRD